MKLGLGLWEEEGHESQMAFLTEEEERKIDLLVWVKESKGEGGA